MSDDQMTVLKQLSAISQLIGYAQSIQNWGGNPPSEEWIAELLQKCDRATKALNEIVNL